MKQYANTIDCCNIVYTLARACWNLTYLIHSGVSENHYATFYNIYCSLGVFTVQYTYYSMG